MNINIIVYVYTHYSIPVYILYIYTICILVYILYIYNIYLTPTSYIPLSYAVYPQRSPQGHIPLYCRAFEYLTVTLVIMYVFLKLS